MKALKLETIYNQTIWGNNVLSEIRNRPSNMEGTAWEISAHPSADCPVLNKEYEGKTLTDLIKENPIETLGSEVKEDRMLRLALLDAKESLSIQVHPNEEYAQKNENDHGKTESWYVLRAEEGAKLVAGCDFKTKEEIKQAIDEGTIEEHLTYHPVKEGDFIAIPAGTLHALGANILALEIGTNSNTTYRFFDFNRVDDQGNTRPLHIEKSLDVVTLGEQPVVVSTPLDGIEKEKLLTNVEEFEVYLVDTNDTYTIKLDGTRFKTISNLGEKVTLQYDDEEVPLDFTESMFIPASSSDIVVKGKTRLLIAQPK